MRSLSTRIDALPNPDRIWTVADLGEELPVQELTSFDLITRVNKQPASGLVEWQTTPVAAELAERYGIDLIDIGREPLAANAPVVVTDRGSEVYRDGPERVGGDQSRQLELTEI